MSTHERNSPGVIVGREVHSMPLRFYAVLPPDCDDTRPDSVRALLEGRLNELETYASAVRDIFATDDPERAEQFLFDGMDVAVTQVVLRPLVSEATVFDFTQRRFTVP